MIRQKFSAKQIKDIQATREIGISIGRFGFSKEYDAVFAPFMRLAGLIGQYEKALQTHMDSPNVSYWISEQRRHESEFVARYRAFFIEPQKGVQFLPQKWVVDFYTSLKHRE